MLLVWMVSCLGFFILVAYLEEPCFHALSFVSSLNGDSLSLNVGPPWCSCGGSGDAGDGEWLQGCPRQEEQGVVSIEELQPRSAFGRASSIPGAHSPTNTSSMHDRAPVQTPLSSDWF